MSFGAGTIAAKRFSAAEIVDPHRFAVGSIRDTLSANPHIGPLLPAAGYSQTQMRELETTINSVPCDLVLFATPIDLPRLMTVDKPAVRIRYAYRDHGEPTLAGVLTRRLSDLKTGAENSPS
jgi:predicted GTPase